MGFFNYEGFDHRFIVHPWFSTMRDFTTHRLAPSSAAARRSMVHEQRTTTVRKPQSNDFVEPCTGRCSTIISGSRAGTLQTKDRRIWTPTEGCGDGRRTRSSRTASYKTRNRKPKQQRDSPRQGRRCQVNIISVHIIAR